MDKSNSDLIYNLLKSGVSEDEITSLFNEAQARIDKEAEDARKAEAEAQAREAAMDEARADLVDCIEWWIIALGNGIAPAEDDEEGWDILHNAIEKAIISIEKSLLNTKVTVKTGKDAESELDKIQERYNNLYKKLWENWW